MPEFSKIKGGYGSNVRNNRFANSLDYANEFDNIQMKIMLCSVPWDVGNIHVGNSVISGKGNVVGWESTEQRDSYFSQISDKWEFSTKFRKYHNEDTITVPLPFYEVAQYNYIVIEHEDFPTRYGVDGAIRKFFYFIRDFEMKAPNSTEVIILRDDWTTYINQIRFKEFSMVRGHYAIANSSVENYLSNPLKNSKYLLSNSSETQRGRVASESGIIFNSGEQLFVMAFKGDPVLSEQYQIYHTAQRTESAFNEYLLIMDESSVTTALANMQRSIYKALLWCAFVPAALVRLDDADRVEAFTVECWHQDISETKQTGLVRLDKSKFGYPEEYSDLAKLYTYPYAALQIYDASGDSALIRVEDTTGEIVLNSGFLSTLSGLTLSGVLEGIGGASSSYTIKSIGSRNVFLGGKWYGNLFTWDVPTFALVQWGYDSNYVDTLSDCRAREDIAAENASAASDNTATGNAANTATTAVANNTIDANTATDNILLAQSASLANGVTIDTAVSNIDAANMQGSISAAQTFLNGISSANSSLGLFEQAYGEISAGIANVANSFTAGANSASLAIANGLTLEQARITRNNNNDTLAITLQSNRDKAATAKSANTDTTEIANTAASTLTARSNQASLANAAELNTQIRENGYRIDPPTYGIESGNALTPWGIWCNIETATLDDIRATGDDFLRYGYPFEGRVRFTTFNVMPKFSYWQIDDMWIEPSGLSDKALDNIRFLLMGGVTVWNPEYIDQIGRISIYDNK